MIPDKSLTIVVSYPTKASCYQFVTPAAGAAANARRSKMRKIMIVAAAAAIASLTGAAIANEELRASRDVPREQRISPDEMKAKLDKLGYDVR
jgi:Peptidase propeptide and YPEB domain